MSRTIQGRWRGLRCRACIAAVIAVAACEGGGDGAGGSASSGPGPGSRATGGGGSPPICTELVDSLHAVEGATTPHLVKADGGYLLAVVAEGEVQVLGLDESLTVKGGSLISSASGLARSPSMGLSGEGYSALWSQGGDIVARPLDGTGKPTGPSVTVASVSAAEPRPATAGTGAILGATWMDGPSTSVAGVLEGGALTQAAPVPGWFPAIATSSANVAIAWSEGGDGGAVQVALLGAVTQPITVAGSSALIKSMIGVDDDFIVAWEDVSSGTEQVRLARVDVGGSVVAETTVAPTLGAANWPSVAWSGERLAVAYYQFRDEGPSVFIGFFDGALRPVDDEVRVADDAKYPSVAWGPSGVAVAYASQGGAVEVSLVACP